MVNIIHLSPRNYTEFLTFNAKSYPRRNNIKKRFEFQVLRNPLITSASTLPILIAYDEHNHIVGQLGLSPQEYCLNGEKKVGFFGYDLFVSEPHRGQGIGSSLVKRALQNYSPFFPTGISKDASKLYSSFNLVGEEYTFLWVRNPLKLFQLGFNHLLESNHYLSNNYQIISSLPATVSYGSYTFNLIHNFEGLPEHYANKDTLELSRSAQFLQWHFSNTKKYKFYVFKKDNIFAYFVIRSVNLKGLNLLAIVDYRIPFIYNESLFKAILEISKQLTRKIKFAGVITLSSHLFFDISLKKNLFIKIGKSQGIFVDCNLPLSVEKIKNRESLLFTMTDADLEFAYW